MTDAKAKDERLVLDTIKRLIAARGGISPTIDEIKDRAGMSYGTTYLTVERLQDKNKIKKIRGVYRSIQIVKRTRKKKAA